MEGIHPLKAYRESQKPRLTQKQLADLLGVSKAAVSRWETGTRRVDGARLATVADRTGISPAELRPDLADTWQPIETAPKDGTQFLAFDPKHGRVVLLFGENADDGHPLWEDTVQEYWPHYQPTHWMPLPEPPVSS